VKTQPCRAEVELGSTSPLRWLCWAAWVVSGFFSPVRAQSCWCGADNSLGVLKPGLAGLEENSRGAGKLWRWFDLDWVSVLGPLASWCRPIRCLKQAVQLQSILHGVSYLAYLSNFPASSSCVL